MNTPILDAWFHYMEDVPAPTSYIEMSFYSMIASALQRRVYMGSSERPIFPNMFVVLVGPPATGKGLAIFPVKELLESFKQNRLAIKSKDEILSSTPEEQLRIIEGLTREYAETNNTKISGIEALSKKEPLLLPIAAQAVTYEALVKAHAESLRTIVVSKAQSNSWCKGDMYSHSSLSLICEEISSLMRKHTEDTVNYLITAYDCRNYDYDTKNKGSFSVRNPCLNLIGGTQPNFIKRVFQEQLLTEGFASRTLFVYEDEPRFIKYDISQVSADQKASFNLVRSHVEKLTKIFGNAKESEECHNYMRHMVESVWPKNKRNNSPKLEHYYGRKPINFRKLTMATHYGENVGMEIGIRAAERAVNVMDRIERKMDKALSVGGRNELVTIYDKILKHLSVTGKATQTDIWMAFIDDIKSQNELQEIISFLVQSNKVKVDGNYIKL